MAVSMKNVDAAFHNVGGKAGTEIWRIENFNPVLLSPSEHGKFYKGDSYIVLRKYVNLQTKPLKSGAFHYDIHFWLGQSTSQDEAGAAAIKAVELDAALGGRAVQFREVEGQESDLFLSYFKPCIIPLEGGVASGFKKVEEEDYEPHLYVCKGSRVVHVTQVPNSRQSLNHDDVFILDTENKIYQFNGANSSIQERGKALEVVEHLKAVNHSGKCAVVVVDDGKLGSEAEAGEFWALFGGFAPLGKKSLTVDNSKTQPLKVKLFCNVTRPPSYTQPFISSSPTELPFFKSVGEGKVSEVDHGSGLKKNLLDSHNCYLLDITSEMFVWMGRDTSLDQRKAASLSAEEYISSEERPFTHVTRLIEGFETPKFRSLFEKWPRSSHAAVTEEGRGKVAAMLKKQGVDVKGLMRAAPTSEDAPPLLLESSGKLQVWRVDGSDRTVLPAEEYGKFFDGHCYIVLYTYHGDRKEDFLLCTWLGKNHSAAEGVEAAKLSNKMWDRLKGRPVQVRIFQGREPPQFLALFPCLIILEGQTSELRKENTYLFRVQGTNSGNSLSLQVDPVSGSLNSSECFVLLMDKLCYMWSGSFSNSEQQKVAMKVTSILQLTAKPVREGSEPSAFWNMLGGKQTGYAAHRDSKDSAKDPRLFSCSYSKGKLQTTEVFNFDQDDLLTEEVMILDTFSELFVWIGYHSSSYEKQHAVDFAKEHLETRAAQEGMPPKATLYKITEGNEPVFFTSYFSWSATKVMVNANTYTKRLARLQGRKIQSTESQEDAATQRKSAMAALSVVFNSPSEHPTSPRSSVGGSPRSQFSQFSSATSQRAAALAALSAALGEPQAEQAPSTLDAEWVAVSSPTLKSEDGGSLIKADDELEESTSEDGSFEYERLKSTSRNPVRGINIKRRESYLSEEAFEKLFSMKKEKFYELPKWKQDQRKRVLDLF